MDQKYKLVDPKGRTVANPTNLRKAVKALLAKPGLRIANSNGVTVLARGGK